MRDSEDIKCIYVCVFFKDFEKETKTGNRRTSKQSKNE